jgi:hypothetical protein
LVQTTYTIRHGRMIARAHATLGHKAEVSFPSLTGTFTVTHEGQMVSGIAGEIQLAFDPMEGGDMLLRREARKALDTSTYPAARLALEGAAASPGALAKLSGQLSYRGRSVGISPIVDGRFDEHKVEARTRFTLDVRDFGLKPPRLLFLKVDEIVEVEVELFAAASAA